MADTSHSLNERRDVFPEKSQIGQRVLAILHGPDTWRVSVVVKFSHLGAQSEALHRSDQIITLLKTIKTM